MKWEREGTGYDIQYALYNPSGLLIATAYRGGNKWYPWSWYLHDNSKKHGESTTLHSAKNAAERAYKS